MADVVIRAEDLWKQYRIGLGRSRRPTLRDALAGAAERRLHAARRALAGGNGDGDVTGTMWALRGVSFRVERGDLVGIIGRNGAGKTTLLKVLARITEPTSGVAGIKGRVGSLLDVGTGFHAELTGRENVFLNGAILGMRRSEIDKRFDEIVDFAEIEKFLDTPVKRYSSGMIMRLGFSVAAHLEPEILLVDEVLAVGDVAFQKKCLGKMGEVAHEGRTVLFVSHNIAVMRALCRRGIFIEQGEVHADAPIEEAVDAYLASVEEMASEDLRERRDRRGWEEVNLTRVDIGRPDAVGHDSLATGRPARFVFHVTELGPSVTCSFTIVNDLGHSVTSASTTVGGPKDSVDAELGNCFACEVDELPLVPGRYRLDVEIRARGIVQDALEGAAVFDVDEGTLEGRPVWSAGKRGDVVLRHRWIRPAEYL